MPPARQENANQADIAAMRQIATDAMRAGAFGFSTSRTISHKTLAGEYIPTLRAQEEELTGIDGTAPRQHQWAGSSAPYR